MQPGTIIFDLDGTFADTAPDIIDSLNHCLNSEGMDPADAVNVSKYVGHGARVMIARAFEMQDRALPKALHDRLFAMFLDHYRDNIPGRSRPFDGAVDVVAALRETGYRTGICTNKFEALAVALLDSLDLSHLFDAVCGSETFPFRKPDPRHLTETIRAAGGAPHRSVMVGDSKTDIDTAKAAGVPVVAVDFGYSLEHVSTFAPDRVISHFSELTPALAETLIGKSAERPVRQS